jgi:PII-like signaling protein
VQISLIFRISGDASDGHPGFRGPVAHLHPRTRARRRPPAVRDDRDLAGATVLRGPMGFGQSRRLHNANILDLSGDLPLVIEIVDAEDKLRAFCRSLGDLKDIGLVTLEKVEILHYGQAAADAAER